MAAELAHRHGYYLVAFPPADPERIEGYAGLRAPRGAQQADIQTIAVVPGARRGGLGRALMGALIAEARDRGVREIFLEVRADNQGARALYESLGFEPIAVRPGYYHRRDRRRRHAARGARGEDGSGMRSARARHRVELRRDRGRHRARHRTARQRHRLLDGRARALRRCGARGRGPGSPRGAHPGPSRGARAIRHRAGRPRRDRRHERTRPRRRAHGRGRRRQGSRPRARQAPLRRQPSRRLTSASICSTTMPSSTRRSPCSSRAATHRCCSCAISSTTSNCSARRSTTPRGRPSTRSPACSGCPIRAAPRSTPRPRAATQPPSVSRADSACPRIFEAHRYDFSFSGLKTAVARWVERERDAGAEVPIADVAASFREAVADVLVTKAVAACTDLGVPRLLLGGGVVANARVRQLAGERCAAAGIALRIPPLSLCTDNGAMIASSRRPAHRCRQGALGARIRGGFHPSGHDDPGVTRRRRH